MRRALAALLLAVAAVAAGAAAERIVTDGAGRRVAVPGAVERVFPAGPPASVVIFALAPRKLLGWTRAFTDEERAFMPPGYADLPVVGRLAGRGSTANVESVLALRPDLVLDVGSTSPTFASSADRVQAQTGLPYLLLDGTLPSTPALLRTLGTVLGDAQRGEALARHVETVLGEVRIRVAGISPDQRPRVYYARGPAGLQTALSGSINAEAFDLLGVRNVAGDVAAARGVVNVSLEQVLAWDPDVIVTIDPHFYRSVRSDPRWKSLRAVREGRVHLSPWLPFGWVDFPPGPNRVLGLEWLARVLYPAHFPADMAERTRQFFRLFYHLELTPEQLAALLNPPA